MELFDSSYPKEERFSNLVEIERDADMVIQVNLAIANGEDTLKLDDPTQAGVVNFLRGKVYDFTTYRLEPRLVRLDAGEASDLKTLCDTTQAFQMLMKLIKSSDLAWKQLAYTYEALLRSKGEPFPRQ